MTGIDTLSAMVRVRSMLKPSLVPSLSIEVSNISPAPNSAIFFEDHYFCYVVENDIAKKVEVEISDSDNTNISVISLPH